MIHDRDAFWEAQNREIKLLETKLEKQGHASVEIVRGASFQKDAYDVAEGPEGTLAVIVVAPDGEVSVHNNLVPRRGGGSQSSEPAPDREPQFGQDLDAAAETSPVSITERTATGRAAEYLASLRTAVAGNLVAGDIRLAMAVTLAALMGERSVGLDWAIAAGGDAELTETFNEHVTRAGDDPLGYLVGIPAQELYSLYGIAVAVRLRHQVGRKAAFVSESIVSRILAHKKAEGYALRQDWTPDREFFETLGVQELRILAAELLAPEEIELDLQHSGKPDIVALLERAFASAREGEGQFSAMTEMTLNAWMPHYVF